MGSVPDPSGHGHPGSSVWYAEGHGKRPIVRSGFTSPTGATNLAEVLHLPQRVKRVGGGYSEDQNVFVSKIVVGWAVRVWFVVPYNLVIMLIAACFPPFAPWYEQRVNLRDDCSVIAT